MTAFGAYARYYDLLYGDKDYRGETEFVDHLIRKHTPDARRVLELGCGTGIHGALLAEAGYEVTGLDLSEDMLVMAGQRVGGLPPDIAGRVRFLRGDARDFRLDGKFDAVIALFHVMSYQQGNDDLRAVFARVKEHLAPGGVFIFDCWYGPAVLTDRPTVRVKRFADAVTRVTRIAMPEMDYGNNCVDVNYLMFIQDGRNGATEELAERHRVRYLFRSEVELLTKSVGLRIEASGGWLTQREPDSTTWYAYFVIGHQT